MSSRTDRLRQTPLDRLRRSPTRQSAPALVEALQRLVEVGELGVGELTIRRFLPVLLGTIDFGARHW